MGLHALLIIRRFVRAVKICFRANSFRAEKAMSIRTVLFGKPKDPLDPKVFHQVSLVAFLAWVGLGADGLSSSAYGPEEAYLALGEHYF
jgi:hypothetical protein